MLLGKQEHSGGGGFRECQNTHMQQLLLLNDTEISLPLISLSSYHQKEKKRKNLSLLLKAKPFAETIRRIRP